MKASKRCPNYLRKTAGQYYYGIRCSNYWAGRDSLGYLHGFIGQMNWSKDSRDKYVKDYCLGTFGDCTYYQRPVGLKIEIDERKDKGK